MEQLSSITRMIKQSICFRAKYLVDQKKVMSPMLVVPHPKNRGGDAVKSLRTKQLIGTVTVVGYDSIEANCNAVAVEEKPAVAGGSGTFFQDEFAKKVKPDPDMAERGSGMVAIAGSLSHSHWNCGVRNILCGTKGCECHEQKACDCGSHPILDKNGNYSLEKLRVFDEQWAQDCFFGLEWEILSWKMDVEEPEAAQIISVALNKKNEVAMKTGHLRGDGADEGVRAQMCCDEEVLIVCCSNGDVMAQMHVALREEGVNRSSRGDGEDAEESGEKCFLDFQVKYKCLVPEHHRRRAGDYGTRY